MTEKPTTFLKDLNNLKVKTATTKSTPGKRYHHQLITTVIVTQLLIPPHPFRILYSEPLPAPNQLSKPHETNKISIISTSDQLDDSETRGNNHLLSKTRLFHHKYGPNIYMFLLVCACYRDDTREKSCNNPSNVQKQWESLENEQKATGNASLLHDGH